MRSEQASVVLALGAAAGLALAAYGIARPTRASNALPSDAVASVDGVPISRADYQTALGALATARRDGAAAGDAERVLDRLIEEELLLQRALELGLARRDARARAALVSALVASIALEAEAAEPDDAELRRHFEQHRDYFRGSELVRVEQWFFAVGPEDDDARIRARARSARARVLAGEPVSDADPEPVPLPGRIPAHKLVDLLGPTAARAALELSPGGVSEPARSGAGYHVLRLVERRPASMPRFEDVRAEVRADFVRRAADRRLRQRLDELRQEARVVVAKP